MSNKFHQILIANRDQRQTLVNKPVRQMILDRINLLADSESLDEDTEFFSDEQTKELNKLLKPAKLNALQKKYDHFIKELRIGISGVDKQALIDKVRKLVLSGSMDGVSLIYLETDFDNDFSVEGFDPSGDLLLGPVSLVNFYNLYPSLDLIEWMEDYELDAIYEIPKYLSSELYLIFYDVFTDLQGFLKQQNTFTFPLDITIGEHDEERFHIARFSKDNPVYKQV